MNKIENWFLTPFLCRELVERGILVQNPGGGRSTSYRLVELGED